MLNLLIVKTVSIGLWKVKDHFCVLVGRPYSPYSLLLLEQKNSQIKFESLLYETFQIFFMILLRLANFRMQFGINLYYLVGISSVSITFMVSFPNENQEQKFD